MHLLAGRDQCIVALAVEPMEHVQPLVVDARAPAWSHTGARHLGLAEVLDVAFDGVEHPASLAEGIVDSDAGDTGVHGLAEHVAVREVGHMAVVVDPLRPHRGLVPRQSFPPSRGLASAGLPDRAAPRACAASSRRRYRTGAAPAGWRRGSCRADARAPGWSGPPPAPGCPSTMRSISCLGELRRLELGPRPFQRGAELMRACAACRSRRPPGDR